MENRSHDTVVLDQFDARAKAYVASPVHAGGDDLDRLAGIAVVRRPANVLDIGCGGGHAGMRVAHHSGKVVALDLSEEMLRAVAAEAGALGLGNVWTTRGSARRIPFSGGVFDLVVSRYSAHHWRDLPACLKEAGRVLKSGGLAVFMDTVAPGDPVADTWLQAVELLRDPSHVRDYSPGEWLDALEVAGFEPATVTRRRLRLEFSSWVARMSPPEVHVQAIRSLQALMPAEVAEHFELEEDGSFTVDTMMLEAEKA